MKRRIKVILGAGAVLLVFWGTVRFLFEGWFVNGDAMTPTYNHGDLLLGYKLAYSGPEDVRRGDIVVVRHSPRGSEEYQVWRVERLPGEAVQLPSGEQAKLATGTYFLRGDNPAGALDSRTFGPVSFDRIRFKVIGRLVEGRLMNTPRQLPPN